MKMQMPLLAVKISVVVLLLLQVACGGNREQTTPSNGKSIEEQLIEVNKHSAEIEEKLIKQYLTERGVEMQRSGTGMWYHISNPGVGDSIVEGQLVTIDFDVIKLNDSIIYTSKDKKPYKFKLGMSDIESGLHEGISMLKQGAVADFILPSYLAHGLTGDGNKIPPKTPLKYKIHVLEVY